MPEGPSIVILKEAVQSFKGKKVVKVSGNTKVAMPVLEGQRVIDFKSWGKHFLICFRRVTIRIHFMLFGSYRINEEKDTPPRLGLQFENGALNFYACSVKLITEPLDEVYDWSGDVLSDTWDPGKARKKLKALPDLLVCDALLEQNIFAGAGNIIKNEVLFRIRVHPRSKVGKLPAKQLNLLIKEAVNYSYDFLEWKKAFVLKKHWLAHTKKICPRCNIPLIKEHLGKTNRRSFFCNNCQVLYQ
ncbi:DNA-formamidopyrimidine glycosylase family protein [uncultured Chitinophaga sp.]|jgi:Formamidopyrimidine-DNA glycosylase|uniref:DNA-formamidopyrimidine glycosylase family protein n=1 Tax=uncultured Chitinophaga sp. TaxID=339340 RepID=UPI002607B077|nr:DNA-formamidopyrimidine glycosylase family protein [uncultured Chitinophaga sp.]